MRTVISPFVSVPVLSEQIMVVAPKVSAEASLLIIALRLASSRAPRASDMVTTAGKPSGTAETASATATINASVMFPMASPAPPTPTTKISYNSRANTIAHITTIIIPNFLAKRANFCLRGVSTASTA